MDYRVTDTELTSVADAIRAKAESQDPLAWPNGFANKVASITGISSADEGKVVSNGTLVAQTSTNVTENGTYDTTTNDEVVVAVSESGMEGITFDTRTPVSSDGSDGDYWYQRTKESKRGFNFIPNSTASSAMSAGQKFTVSEDVTIHGLAMFARNTTVSVYLSAADGTELASFKNVQAIVDEWNYYIFQTPIMLSKNTEYVVWGSNAGNYAMRYKSGALSNAPFTYVQTVYSRSANTFPNTSESGLMYGADVVVDEEGEYIIRTQWFKKSGAWQRLA